MLPPSFPDKYIEGNTEIPFHTDFRQWMRFEELITDSRIDRDVALVTGLRMIFPERQPSDMFRGAMFMLWFYRCGEAPSKAQGSDGAVMDSRKAYSFEHDFGFIAAAFLEQYGIDLWEIPYMHWWKFIHLFRSLHDTRFTDICSWRSTDLLDDGLTDKMRDFIEEKQEQYRLPVSANEQRQIEAARRYLEGGI